MQKKKLNPAWVNVIALCMLMAGTYGILVNCIGILFTAVMADTGISNGALSVYYTVRNLTCALTVVFTVKLFNKKNAKVVVACLGIVMALSVGSMTFFNKVYQWYIAAVFTGLGQSCIYTIAPIVINNWFRSRNGFALGLSMAASGLFSTVFSPIASAIIMAIGWRGACLVLMAISLALTLPSALLIRRDCESAGFTPYGLDLVPEKVKKTREKRYIVPGTCAFVALMIYVAFGSIFAPINHQIAVFGNSTGFGLTFGAILTSCSMVGNIAGKFGVGTLSDRVGIFKAMVLSLSTVIIGLLLFCLCGGNRLALMAGAFFYGVTYAFPSAQSLLCLEIYGPEKYKERLAIMSSAGGIVGACMSTVVGFIYDAFQSFTPVFIYAACAALVEISICIYLGVYKSRMIRKEDALKTPAQ